MFSVHQMALVAGVVAIGLSAGASHLMGQSQGDMIGELSSNEGTFVDSRTFKIAKGQAKSDPAAVIAKLSAKEVDLGAITFSSGASSTSLTAHRKSRRGR